MKDTFKKFLFAKHYFVNDTNQSENTFEVLFSLANLFGIKIRQGQALVSTEHIRLASTEIGKYVPDAFYKNFPQSVLQLTKDQLLFDQLVHYTVTYGFGNFENPGYSLFEADFERLAFNEQTEVKLFDVIDEAQAVKILTEAVVDLLGSSRSLSATQYEVVLTFIREYDYKITYCTSKNTLVKLLVDLRDVTLAKHLVLSDLLKAVEYLDYKTNREPNVKKLHFRNAERKFLTQLLDYAFENCHCNTLDCYERKAIWCGFLHHVHYQPKNDVAKAFVEAMRQKGNKSVYSQVEEFLSVGEVENAVTALKNGKGGGAILRNLNYLLSRCQTDKQVEFVLQSVDTDNVMILLQLLYTYSMEMQKGVARTFKFVRFNTLATHTETDDEVARRKTVLEAKLIKKVAQAISKLLAEKLKNRVGKVYIADQMDKMALPLQQGANLGGLGVLATGSRLPLPPCKKIRAFTYWEKVNDIDLSVIGLGEKGEFMEFSWRTMYANQSAEITYSGDQTSGFKGGVEYFDVNIPKFKRKFKDLRYLVFCNNVFSGVDYSQIFCKAGYMLRDEEESGEVFEPKTVQSSFIVNCDSIYACLFALDLQKEEFVWLNSAMQLHTQVAGIARFDFLIDYIRRTDVISLADFFKMMATKVVSSPQKADLILSDNPDDEIEGKQVIHSYDFEKITKYFG